ncbi:MAG: hypothetical protein NTY80_01155 [candidate division SR1 bacterium]|nr:hypothetical protein [candidate division SR1 bacterium]
MPTKLIILILVGASLILGSSFAGTGIVFDPTNSGIFLGLPDIIGEGELTGGGQGWTGNENASSGLYISGADIHGLSGEFIPNIVPGSSGGDENSGMLSDPIFHLIISEVYYDGTDEWIEITNIGDGNFQGNFTLSGAKSTLVSLPNISLFSGESKVFGDTLAQVSGTWFIGKTGLALGMADTAALNIFLNISGQMVDSFSVDSYRVNQYNDKKTSFERVGAISTPAQTGRRENAQSGYIINPGVYFVTGENIFDVYTLPSQQSGVNLELPVPCDFIDQGDLVKINEIFAGNEKYPPYIELAIHANTSLDSLSISGNRLGTGVEFLLISSGTTLEKNTILLLSATGTRKTEGINSVRNSDFSLLSTGAWIILTAGSGQTRRVLDIAYLSGNSGGKSYYFGSTSYQCARILDDLDDFSPGFERQFLKYFPGTTITNIEYVSVNTGNNSDTGACQSLDQVSLFSGETTTAISGSITGQYSIHILNVDYDPEGSDTNNEKITLLASHISGDVSPLDLSKVFRLKVNGTNKTLPWLLPINTPTTFTKTFGFPNSTSSGQGVVVSLTYGDYVFDTYTYTPNTTISQDEEEITSTGDLQYTGTLVDISDIEFSIRYVLPNPKGSDTKEEIGIGVHSKKSPHTGINLSDGFYLKVGSKKKKLGGILEVNKENILVGSLGLVNRAACVSLLYKEQELVKFCYGSPKEGQKIYVSSAGLEEIPMENLDILNQIQLKKLDNKLCVWYNGEAFSCKNIPAGKAALKTIQEQKLYKGLVSLIKQYIISNWRSLYYDTPIKDYFDRVVQDKKAISQGFTHVDIYGQSVLITDLKEQLQIIENTLPGIVAIFGGKESLVSSL